MSLFVHAQGIKTVHAGGGGFIKGQNSVHVDVECPLYDMRTDIGAQVVTLSSGGTRINIPKENC